MVEGIIVLPLFVIVLAAVIYFHRAYATKISLGIQARSCAWSYAVNGCQKEFETVGCPVSRIGETENGSGFGANFLPGMTTGTEAAVTNVDSGASAIDKELGTANEITLTVLQLSEGITVTPSGTVKQPSILGGGTHTISSNYSVMCNERTRTIADLVAIAYCSIDSALPGCPTQK